jgi:AbrB family looped-hinge helix DNA binding protein
MTLYKASLKWGFPINEMGTALETVVDERGRVLIPQELREEAGLEEGTVVKLERGKGRTIQIAPVKGGRRPAWRDLNGMKPRRTGKPEWPTPEEIKGIWE